MQWQQSPQYQNMPYDEYLRSEEGRRYQDATRQRGGVMQSQPQGGPKQSMLPRPGMAQPAGPSDNGTPYGAGFVQGADSKPDFMFDYEWQHLQRKRQANQRAAYDREYLAKYAPGPAKEQKPLEPYIVQNIAPGHSAYVPNPAWGAQHGMTLLGNQWFPSSLLGGATGSMSDYWGGDMIPRLGQSSPYSTYMPKYQSAPQQYGPAQPSFLAPPGRDPRTPIPSDTPGFPGVPSGQSPPSDGRYFY
jgi:hypothetical protein